MTTSGISHSFDIGIAAHLGVHAALVYTHVCYWISSNIINGINLHDGRTWTFQTKKQIAAHFPYLTFEQVKHALEKLVEEEFLLTGNYNSDKFKRDLWYAIPDENILKLERDSKKVFEKGKFPYGEGKIPLTLKIINNTDTPIPKEISKDIPLVIGAAAQSPPLNKTYFSPDLSAEDKAKDKGKLVIPLQKWQDYIDEYGEALVKQAARDLSNKNAESPKKYKATYLTLLTFIKNRKEWSAEQKAKTKFDFRKPSGIGDESFRPKTLDERFEEEEAREKELAKAKK